MRKALWRHLLGFVLLLCGLPFGALARLLDRVAHGTVRLHDGLTGTRFMARLEPKAKPAEGGVTAERIAEAVAAAGIGVYRLGPTQLAAIHTRPTTTRH